MIPQYLYLPNSTETAAGDRLTGAPAAAPRGPTAAKRVPGTAGVGCSTCQGQRNTKHTCKDLVGVYGRCIW